MLRRGEVCRVAIQVFPPPILDADSFRAGRRARRQGLRFREDGGVEIGRGRV